MKLLVTRHVINITQMRYATSKIYSANKNTVVVAYVDIWIIYLKSFFDWWLVKLSS